MRKKSSNTTNIYDQKNIQSKINHISDKFFHQTWQILDQSRRKYYSCLFLRRLNTIVFYVVFSPLSVMINLPVIIFTP